MCIRDSRNGLGSGWSWMAGLFALFGMLAGFGIGNGVQAFEVSSALSLIGIPKLATGIVLAAMVFAVVIGGIKRIAQAASAIVPLMSILYVAACLLVLLANLGNVPEPHCQCRSPPTCRRGQTGPPSSSSRCRARCGCSTSAHPRGCRLHRFRGTEPRAPLRRTWLRCRRSR